MCRKQVFCTFMFFYLRFYTSRLSEKTKVHTAIGAMFYKVRTRTKVKVLAML